jgi:alpha-glucosidase
LPLAAEFGGLRHVRSSNAPDIGMALDAIRQAVGDSVLVGEVFLPTAELGPYLDVLDVAFAFEPMFASDDPNALRSAILAAYQRGKLGWVLSNHDFVRHATRFGASARAAAMLFMALPGPLFMLQGDELEMPDGPGGEPPLDRAGRDRHRHPMQWDGSPNGGFTTGMPWLPLIDPRERNVEGQKHDKDSTLWLYRHLIGLRRTLSGDAALLDSPDQTIVLKRGQHRVAVNLGEQPADLETQGEILAEARPGDAANGRRLPPHGGVITRS